MFRGKSAARANNDVASATEINVKPVLGYNVANGCTTSRLMVVIVVTRNSLY
jgi:hypothetical protein